MIRTKKTASVRGIFFVCKKLTAGLSNMDSNTAKNKGIRIVAPQYRRRQTARSINRTKATFPSEAN